MLWRSVHHFCKGNSFQIIQWCCELFCFVFSWACLLWWGVRLNICPPVLPLHTGNRRNQVLSTGKLKNLLILSFSIRFCIYCACFASYSRSIYSVGNMSSLRDLFGFYLKKSRLSNFYCYWRLFSPLFLEVDFTEVTNASIDVGGYLNVPWTHICFANLFFPSPPNHPSFLSFFLFYDGGSCFFLP